MRAGPLIENVLNPTPSSQDQAVCSRSFQISNIIIPSTCIRGRDIVIVLLVRVCVCVCVCVSVCVSPLNSQLTITRLPSI